MRLNGTNEMEIAISIELNGIARILYAIQGLNNNDEDYRLAMKTTLSLLVELVRFVNAILVVWAF